MTFIINPHGRLQEWIAEEHGYFAESGLSDYRLESHSLLTKNTPQYAGVTSDSLDIRQGAYQTYESGREASISCACHWTVNMAAAANHGKLWGECYSISPCAIVVPVDSPVARPEDLAGVNIHVGYQSGSHYTTIQALEPFIDSNQIKLVFGGNPAERVDQLLNGSAPAATVFGPQLYTVEQLGFRKILDATFMVTANVPENVELAEVSKYYEALRRAQTDLDHMHQRYTHMYLNELPERHARLVDVRRFGPGERLVFEPYTETVYNQTRTWVLDREIFPDPGGYSSYEEAVLRI